jgi:hypothetical protein
MLTNSLRQPTRASMLAQTRGHLICVPKPLPITQGLSAMVFTSHSGVDRSGLGRFETREAHVKDALLGSKQGDPRG